MTKASIGEQELALLRHIADQGGASVGDVAESFGTPRGLARSTVLTMMERLRKKGLLARKLAGGVFQYRAQRSSAELLQGAVERFVERHLEGSVSPFLAYLSDAPGLSDAELSELEQIVGRLKADRKKDRGAK
jgi:predicted transcriptional regulator